MSAIRTNEGRAISYITQCAVSMTACFESSQWSVAYLSCYHCCSANDGVMGRKRCTGRHLNESQLLTISHASPSTANNKRFSTKSALKLPHRCPTPPCPNLPDQKQAACFAPRTRPTTPDLDVDDAHGGGRAPRLAGLQHRGLNVGVLQAAEALVAVGH